MTRGKALLISIVASVTLLGAHGTAPANPGGLPGLAARVGALETTVDDQGNAGALLAGQVDDLQDEVDTLQTTLNTVQNELTALTQNKLLFAVVDADGTLRAAHGVASAQQPVDGSGNLLTGHYHVIFGRDMSLCAVTVTAEPQFSGGIIASINGTFRGSPIHNPNRVIVVLSDHDNDRVNTRFNIIAMCN